ncbi:ABC transporter substrate-binding protein [Rhizobium sp. TRM95111]|uniref:ABC transporter substrate-binding protein n=1 Tax=Rhizobium alarense TaxID=2846851 RepID=UPI001F200728|nr:ABC transporter substrate-binding protein [Rhizobium alarense]MCF3642313.1 ABC transporter substrate-binding protein [Rhizobium alarense]
MTVSSAGLFTRIAAIAGWLALALPAGAADPADWPAVLAEARGETVYFHAWGGSDAINRYISWAGETVSERYGVTVKQVKLDDTARAVAAVVAEKAAGRDAGGSVDLIWINGENFAALKQQGLLLSPGWADRLPNWRYVDHENQPTVLSDFTIATDGLESPWGGAKLVFFHDAARTKAADMPRSAVDLLAWAEANPGRFSYPAPPDFIGSTFLKQVLSELAADRERLQRPVDAATFAADSGPLFDYLDRLHPHLWRSGKAFPQNYPDMKQKLADGELDIVFAFNPAEASAAIAGGELPDTVRAFTFAKGTLGNTHFVAIPYNANAAAGALVLADFLLSPEAQARKQDPAIWGDPTVLALDKLGAADRRAFEAIPLGVATLGPEALGPALPEPHPDWMTHIEAEWTRRYGAAN